MIMGRGSGPEIEAQRGGNLGDGGAAGEGVEAVAAVRGIGRVGGVAVVTEDEVVGGATNSGGGGFASVANLVTEVLLRECVSGVDVVVTSKAEFGGVNFAEE